MRKIKMGPHGDTQPGDKELESKEGVRTSVERTPEEIIMQTTPRKKRASFMKHAEKSEGENLSGDSEAADKVSRENEDE